ncbi:hypothetical protein CPB84DRAFT_1788800 [Gymnopilus junonius]|uniref:WW domain-containing protein n=1 Tax=Gymnopilus junonius TaxID=109634 RepID=A0A9P5NE30_GYMJU|nr:hypothetical protein CPB84DRAFT_1788800 [Gymnopilus junonius]
MATAPPPHLLSLFRQWLLRAVKCGAKIIPSALYCILRKLALFWSILRSRLTRKPLRKKGDEPRSKSSKGDIEAKRSDVRGLTAQAEKTTTSEEDCQYTINPNGEVISLDAVAFSLYPYAGGIHNASRSSQNLTASREAHNLAIAARSSRSASPYTDSASANSNEGFTFTVDSPRSPAPRRQFSLSSPEFYHNPAHSVVQLTDLNHQQNIDVANINVESGSPSPLILETAEHHQLTFTQHTRFSSPQDIEVSSIQIPVITPCLDNWRILPVMPEGTQRYTRRPRIHRELTEMTIQPLTHIFEKPLPPEGWVKVVHPEGGRYFFNSEERTYTDADLYDPKILNQATKDIATLKTFISTNGITLPPDTDLLIDLYYDDDGDIMTIYYYVQHSSRSIFFLDTYEASSLGSWSEIQGARTDCHLRHEIEAQYWYFIQLYPTSLEMSPALAAELRDLILHFIGDCMTSPTSTAPFTLDELFRILPLADSVASNVGYQCTGAMSFLSRQMFVFARSRFLNFYGEPHARLERTFSVHGSDIHQRTWLVKTLSMFLFSAPDFHLRNLQDMWVDGVMNRNVWAESVKKMIDEWQEFVLFATVMLNANVAFLAIQSVDTNSDPYRSPAQIASYCSVIASLGSIVLGLLLVRQNRTKSRESVDEVQAYLERRSHPRLGLETLAILHSLPYALLMWGMVAFMAGFALECFQGSNIQTRTLVGSFSFVVTALILWAVVTSWENQPHDTTVEPPNPTEATAPNNVEGSRKSAMSTPSQDIAEATFFSKLLSVPINWVRKSSMDSARTVV